MPEESKPVDLAATTEAVADVAAQVETEDESEDGTVPATATGEESAAAAKKKKKKSKKKKLKDALTGGDKTEEGALQKSAKGKGKTDNSNPAGRLSKAQLMQLAEFNPTLKQRLQHADQNQLEEMLKTLKIGDLLTGASISGKNHKDMSSYKFWQTQPVPTFEEKKSNIKDAPIENVEADKVSKTPAPLLEGFEWVTVDLDDETERGEVYKLLSDHYVEDGEAMFRFNYSDSFLNWALKSPGWRKDWHVGVRATQSRKLVAFISAIPIQLRVRKNVLNSSEVNFLCVHKKLRSKRMAPVMIREITRRCNVAGVYQAIYTAGIILPTPVTTCRYFHRALDWEKLYEVGFSGLPPGSTKQRQILRNKLPSEAQIEGVREMEKKDVPQVLELLKNYLNRHELAQEFNAEELEHWLLHPSNRDGTSRVIWAYVVENPISHDVTDFFSFYSLESTAIGNAKHPMVRAAYLYYYASESAFGSDKKRYRTKLNALIHDALILALKAGFDVFNALTLLDNPMFLEEQKFGAGDGQLHYYLFNYRAAPIRGGIDANNRADEKAMGGVGLVML